MGKEPISIESGKYSHHHKIVVNPNIKFVYRVICCCFFPSVLNYLTASRDKKKISKWGKKKKKSQIRNSEFPNINQQFINGPPQRNKYFLYSIYYHSGSE